MPVNYTNTSTINPLGLGMLLVCCVALLVVDRRNAFWPIIIMLFFVSIAQRIVIFTLDFNQMRIIALVGLARVLFRGELKNLKRHKLDNLIIVYALVSALIDLARNGSGNIVYEMGRSVDIVAPYFIFRCLVQNYEDLFSAIKILSILTLIVSFFFMYEHATARNLFSIFGGVREYTWIREGKLRCQGAFAHPIIAGTYFAVIMPLFAALLWNHRKVLAITGMTGAMIIVGASSSSTPLFALLSAILGALFFYWREYMQLVRMSVFSLLVLLHIVMKAPVWSLISRVSATGGSTSWYRFMLIDETIRNFTSWVLIGSNAYVGWFEWGMTDLTDEYVRVAIEGGLLSLILFISIIVVAFGSVGRAWRNVENDKGKMIMAWAMGCSLFAMIMSFIGIAVWGQMLMLWPMVLAMIAGIDNHYENANTLAEKI